MAIFKKKHLLHRNRSDNHHVKFSSLPVLSDSQSTVQSTLLAPAKPIRHDTWEDIVVHYLTKLKRKIWKTPSQSSRSTIATHPTPGKRENSQEKFRRIYADTRKERVLRNVMRNMYPHPDKYSSITKPGVKLSDTTVMSGVTMKSCNSRKALMIVQNALDYGLANGVISQNGQYYWIRDKNEPEKKSKLRSRSLTPMPQKNPEVVKHKDCKECKELAAMIVKKQGQAKHPNKFNFLRKLNPFRSTKKCASTKSKKKKTNRKLTYQKSATKKWGIRKPKRKLKNMRTHKPCYCPRCHKVRNKNV